MCGEKRMEVVLNGRPLIVTAGVTVWDLAQREGVRMEAGAAEQNGRLVPNQLWRETLVAPGDVIEVFRVLPPLGG